MAEQKMNQAVEEISVTKSDLRTIFWRSFCHEASYNAERQQALGFAFTLTKLLKKLYKDDKEAYVEACKRHTEFFNLTVQITNFVVGIVTALEEKNAKSQDKNMGPTISAVKSALMGPLAPIGDTFFWGCFRIVAASVGATLALKGNLLGPVLFASGNQDPLAACSSHKTADIICQSIHRTGKRAVLESWSEKKVA